MEGLAENGNWGDLETALQRVQGPPNDAATNLRYAAICATPTVSYRRTLFWLHSATFAWLLELSRGSSLSTLFLLEGGRFFVYTQLSYLQQSIEIRQCSCAVAHVQHSL